MTHKIATSKAVTAVLIGLLFVVGLPAQTTTPKRPVTKKPAAESPNRRHTRLFEPSTEPRLKKCDLTVGESERVKACQSLDLYLTGKITWDENK
jgi:hypothetical protein